MNNEDCNLELNVKWQKSIKGMTRQWGYGRTSRINLNEHLGRLRNVDGTKEIMKSKHVRECGLCKGATE
jgi:hypothetical protein